MSRNQFEQTTPLLFVLNVIVILISMLELSAHLKLKMSVHKMLWADLTVFVFDFDQIQTTI